MNTPSTSAGIASGELSCSDYGRLHVSRGRFLESRPSCIADAQSLIQEANRQRQPVRVRGAGHSMNGSSVPRADEVLISTRDCCHYRFEEELTITVGAGAAVWDVDQMLRALGFQLLLRNDGDAAGPSLGGFASAGGIGPDTWSVGGFWETVVEIVMVTGTGDVVRCSRGDKLISWIFGSAGQLGLIVEMKLSIRPCDDRSSPVYPLGLEGYVARSEPIWEHNVWLTIFAPESSCSRAREQLETISRRHAHVWKPRNSFLYFVRFRTFNPPLVYPRSESFVAVGIWGSVAQDLKTIDVAGLQALEHEFAALVSSEPSYRRYVQSELTFERPCIAGCFDTQVLTEFRAQKRLCDPNGIFGRGSFFD
jgi:FAD binding domain